MLIYTLLFLATASLLYILLRGRDAGWLCWFALAIVSITSWMCAIGAFALAMESQTGFSMGAGVLVAGFALYPFILWTIAKLFERGRRH